MFRTGSRLSHYYIKGPNELEVNVERKLNYLLKTAAHKPESIVKSKVLSFSYKHIVMRHEILVRAGFFKMVPYHKLHKQAFTYQPKTIRDKYFTPTEIVCTDDKSFLKKCTNDCLSLNELVAFEEIFKANYEKWGLGAYDDSFTEEKEMNDDDEDEVADYNETTDPVHHSDSATLFNSKDMSEFYY